ncbi:hypothetical protein C8J56DRAFT_1043029 [Mycena floridula]|nr:hypothetical protein C8J56DRAFT_1043029 [Mycena floridula]
MDNQKNAQDGLDPGYKARAAQWKATSEKRIERQKYLDSLREDLKTKVPSGCLDIVPAGEEDSFPWCDLPDLVDDRSEIPDTNITFGLSGISLTKEEFENLWIHGPHSDQHVALLASYAKLWAAEEEVAKLMGFQGSTDDSTEHIHPNVAYNCLLDRHLFWRNLRKLGYNIHIGSGEIGRPIILSDAEREIDTEWM